MCSIEKAMVQYEAHQREKARHLEKMAQRERIATACLQGILSSKRYLVHDTAEAYAAYAVECADALIKQLED